MTTTDTRAALEAAILKYGGDAADSYEIHARPPDDRDLNAAITAHVAAEVARALACAPGVEEAIAQIVVCTDLMDNAGSARARDALRAAIAADKARAVAGATDGAERAERFADTVCSLVGARDHGCGGQTVDAGTARLYADAVVRIGAIIARDKARPTPDEARRLVEAHHLDLLSIADAVASLHGATGPGLRGHCVAQADKLRLAAGTARAALLRALGVEACD